MSTEIKVWQISDNHIKAVAHDGFAANHLEAELENWIVECPDLLGEDLLILSRQKSIEGSRRLDLLGIDSQGTLVLVELKRGMTPREAVSQALDYASWLENVSETEVLEFAENYLRRPLEDAFAERFDVEEMPTIVPRNHRILLVGSELDEAAERIINYLAQRYSVDINAVLFRYAKLSSGQEILARSVLVAESVVQSEHVARRRPSAAELLDTARGRNTLSMVEALRVLAKSDDYATEKAASSYGGSFRYWRKNMEGRTKMILGVNVSGDRCGTPIGQLDVWIPSGRFGQVLDVPEPQIKEMLQKLAILEMRGNDCIVRLPDEQAAIRFSDQFREWFEEHPGFDRSPASS